jgi:hypothetical protein
VNYIGLLFEIIFFAIGVYLYLFARGLVRTGNSELQKKAEAFRQDNAWWMRLLGLAIAAIMGANIFLHLREIFAAS